MQLVQSLKRRRIALLGKPNRLCLRQFPSFGSFRSGHATRRNASLSAMRRPPQKLYLQFVRHNLTLTPLCLKQPNPTAFGSRQLDCIGSCPFSSVFAHTSSAVTQEMNHRVGRGRRARRVLAPRTNYTPWARRTSRRQVLPLENGTRPGRGKGAAEGAAALEAAGCPVCSRARRLARLATRARKISTRLRFPSGTY